MQWLSGMTAIWAAAGTVPPLVLLYFLKLKRRRRMISSTLLWKRAVQDLQVNAPFRRIRRNILLLIQLLALVAMLAALGRPVLTAGGGPARKMVLLIDRSASMNAVEDGTTRLAKAKRQAKMLIASLRAPSAFALTRGGDQAMVIAFDRQAKVMCNFTADKRQLIAAVDSITPTDAGSMLAEALQVATGFCGPAGDGAATPAAAAAVTLELFSDGKIADLGRSDLTRGIIRFHRIGKSRDNLAVVAMRARRPYEKPQQVDIFAALANYNARPVSCQVQMSLDGNVRAIRQVQVPAARPARLDKPASPGSVSISFSLTLAEAGVVEVRQLRTDALACDDAAWVVLQPPRKLSALLVTKGDAALRSGLAACPLARLDVVTPGQFDAMAVQGTAVGEHDVIVLDNHLPPAGANLGRCNYLIFGKMPRDMGLSPGKTLPNQMIVDWRARHPVLQFVQMDNLYAASARSLQVGRQAEVIAEFAETPAIIIQRHRGGLYILVNFNVMDTNWPFEPGFVMFLYNAMSYLAGESQAGPAGGEPLRADMPVLIEHLPPGAQVAVDGPTGKAKLAVDAAGTLRFAATARAGVYTFTGKRIRPETFAVNVLDAAESDIAPAETIELSGRAIKAQDRPVHKTNVELWPLLAVVALALVCLEWIIYNSKLRL